MQRMRQYFSDSCRTCAQGCKSVIKYPISVSLDRMIYYPYISVSVNEINIGISLSSYLVGWDAFRPPVELVMIGLFTPVRPSGNHA